MNRDFLRPAALIILAAVFTGIIARIIPSWNNDVFNLRKMRWFEALQPAQTSVDSVVVIEETVDHAQHELEPFLKKIGSMDSQPGKEALFERFLFTGREKKIRIAYYSDSIIEGDLITAPLRHTLQSVYGGEGVGMVPITSIVSGFRQTIRHTFSRNWETISFMTRDHYDASLGITGYTFIPRPYYTTQRVIETTWQDTLFVQDSTAVKTPEPPKSETARIYVDYDPWVEYKAVDIPGGAAAFEKIKLYYSHAPDSSFVRVSYDSQTPVSLMLNQGNGLQVLDLSSPEPVKSLRLEFSARMPVHLYGISFDGDSGIYVDNFPIRGYSGLYFQRIHKDILHQFQRKLDYELIILQYGGNITNPQNKNYDNYKLAMIRTIEHIQESVGDVPILLVSVQDRSIKDGNSYKTSPDIPLLVKAQSEVAAETGIAFWNLYDAMGGYNSMLDFVNQNPPLAGKDFTHFTRRGADKIAEMLMEFLQGDS